MPSIEFTVERLLPCECLALVDTPFPTCPCCDGSGESYQEIAVEVEYAYQRACRGARDSLCGIRGAGPPLEPDEPESVEIQSVTDERGREVELTSRENDRAEEECLQDVEERRVDAEEARAEARAEARLMGW